MTRQLPAGRNMHGIIWRRFSVFHDPIRVPAVIELTLLAIVLIVVIIVRARQSRARRRRLETASREQL
jgi:hypothetical protein